MITVLIHHKGSSNLPVLLAQLQPQLRSDDDIYLVDSTKNKTGLAIARIYGTSRSYIFVEVGTFTDEEAENVAFQSAKQNKQKGVLVINENCFISQTFIANLKLAYRLSKNDFGYLFPKVHVLPYSKMDPNFASFNPATKKLDSNLAFTSEVGQCYFIKESSFDPFNHYKIMNAGFFNNETVIVFPYKNPPKMA